MTKCKSSEVAQVLMIADIARPNNSDLLDAKGWSTVSKLVQEDYPWLSVYDLGQIMKTGVKGHFDDFRQVPINCKTIFHWIESGKKDVWSYWRNRLMGEPAAVAVLEDVYSQQELTEISKKIRSLDGWLLKAERLVGSRYVQVVNNVLAKMKDTSLSFQHIMERAHHYTSGSYDKWRFLYEGIRGIIEARQVNIKKIKTEAQIKNELDALIDQYHKKFKNDENEKLEKEQTVADISF